jgi:hypothetical protein
VGRRHAVVALSVCSLSGMDIDDVLANAAWGLIHDGRLRLAVT